MTTQTVTVTLGERSYPIHVGRGALGGLPGALRACGARGAAVIVTDSNVGPLYGQAVADQVRAANLAPVVYTFPAGESHKRLNYIEEMCGAFLEAGLDRSSLVIALGGGVVGDMAGFAAAAYMRGIRFVQIPTTIVAQVDSSVGGKTGVNHPLAKNIIGAFHQPSAVVADLDLLESLPARELRAGMAEVIKHGVIADAELFDYLEKNAGRVLAKDLEALVTPVVRSCEIKAGVVAEDEREQGLRAILNYGHTFGHGIEAATHYGRYLHGEAVALGMIAAAALAKELKMVDAAFVERQRACLDAYQLPVTIADVPLDLVLSAMKHDKKARAGVLTFVVPDAMGHVVQRKDVTEEQARRALQTLYAKA